MLQQLPCCHLTMCAAWLRRNASDPVTMTAPPASLCVCVSGWLHPSPKKCLQSRHVSSAAFLNISYTHWLDRAGQWAGSSVISTAMHCDSTTPLRCHSCRRKDLAYLFVNGLMKLSR